MVRIFPHSDWIRRDTKYLSVSVFSLNAGKYGPEKTPYLDTFHAVYIYSNVVKKTFYIKAVFVSNVITNISGYISKYIWTGDWFLKLFLILILFYLALCFLFLYFDMYTLLVLGGSRG